MHRSVPVRLLPLVASLAAFASPPPHAQTVSLETLPQLPLVEELRIGNHDDPDLGFTRIGPPDVDRDGNIYVFDIQSYHIRVFAPDGRRIRTIGRRGEGPGEFQQIGSLGIKGDTLWASVSAGGGCRQQISLFKRDGTFLSSAIATGLRVPLAGGNVGVEVPRYMRADGTFVGDQITCFTGGAEAAAPGAPSATDTVRVPRVRFDAKGKILDTLGWYSQLPSGASAARRKTVVIEGRNQPVPIAPSDALLKATFADGALVVDRTAPKSASPSTIRVVRTRFPNDTVYDRRFAYTPMRYTDAMLDAIAEANAKVAGGSYELINNVPQIQTFADPKRAQAMIRAELDFPAFQPPITSATIGQDGSVWLMRENTRGAASRFVVLDATGRPRGQLSIPSNVRPVWIKGDTVWGILFDQDDVQYLVRYRVAATRG